MSRVTKLQGQTVKWIGSRSNQFVPWEITLTTDLYRVSNSFTWWTNNPTFSSNYMVIVKSGLLLIVEEINNATQTPSSYVYEVISYTGPTLRVVDSSGVSGFMSTTLSMMDFVYNSVRAILIDEVDEVILDQ